MSTGNRGFWGVIAMTTVLVAIALAALRPTATVATTAAQAGPAVPPQPAIVQREAVYLQEIAATSRLLQERQTVYQAQLDEMANRLQGGQAALDTLAAQEAALQQQLAQLQSARRARLDSYASQLAAARAAYQERFDLMGAQLQEVQAKLAEANAILGR